MKKNQFLYNLKGINYLLYPQFLAKTALKAKIAKIESLKDEELQNLAKKVSYYCSFCASPSMQIPSNPSRIELLKKGSRYFFDAYEYLRFFPKDLNYILAFGDINYELPTPSLCKSRPISNALSNNVLLKLDKLRHFKFFTSPPAIAYEDKKNTLFFRGACYQPHRQDFMQKYFGHSMCDLGHVGSPKKELIAWQKEKISIEKHMAYKFILSLEGNDVASNLKWIMSSNSIAVMPKPKFETWFMEGTLIANQHYIEIKPDYSDLIERLDYFITYPKEAKEIIYYANLYTKQFLDQETEDLISILVLRKYFYLTNQIEISPLEEELFKNQ